MKTFIGHNPLVEANVYPLKQILNRPGIYKPLKLPTTRIIVDEMLSAFYLHDKSIAPMILTNWTTDTFKEVKEVIRVEFNNL